MDLADAIPNFQPSPNAIKPVARSKPPNAHNCRDVINMPAAVPSSPVELEIAGAGGVASEVLGTA